MNRNGSDDYAKREQKIYKKYSGARGRPTVQLCPNGASEYNDGFYISPLMRPKWLQARNGKWYISMGLLSKVLYILHYIHPFIH